MKTAMKVFSFIPAVLAFSLLFLSGQHLFAQTPDQWPEEYVGTWKLTAADGQQRYIVLRSNRTAVTTFDQKVRGNWLYHPDQQEVRMDWKNDWADVMVKKGEGYEVYGYAPGDDPDSGPTDKYAAEKVDLDPFDYFGVWDVTDGAGKHFQITLDPKGAATSTYKGGEKGMWTIHGDKLQINWSNSWRDFIRAVSNDRYQKVAYAPGASLDGKPTNISRAERVKAFIKPGVDATVYQ